MIRLIIGGGRKVRGAGRGDRYAVGRKRNMITAFLWVERLRRKVETWDLDCWCGNEMHGYVGIAFGDYAIHFLVKPPGWVWGHRFTMEGAAIRTWGLGPLMMVVRFEGKT